MKSESKKYEEGGLLKFKNAIKNKWGDMKFDIVVGNPPYGVRQKGSNELHLKIMKTILPFVKDLGKLNFIMPSKPLYYQLSDNWYNMLKNAVCTKIDVQDKKVFKNTKMENTAIYYCECGEDSSKYCKKLDVHKRFENELVSDIEKKYMKYFNTGKTMFKNTLMYRPKSDAKNGFDEYFEIVKKWMTKKYFININNASGSFKGSDYRPGDWISSICEKPGVANYDDEINFLLDNDGRRMILQFDNYSEAKNIFDLLHHPLLRFGLWLQQYSQDMQKECYKYFPDIDYSDIDTDEKLLDKLGCTDPKEQKEILDYVNNFDFTQKRNDRFLKGDVVIGNDVDPHK